MSDLEKRELHQHASNTSTQDYHNAVNGNGNGYNNRTSASASATAGPTKADRKATRKGKLGRHCKRWWWLHFLIFAAIVLIITLPLIYVGYPHIAQDDVNKSKLNVTGMTLTNSMPNSFDTTLDSLITNHAFWHPEIYGFTGSLILADTMHEFLQIPIPKVHAVNHATTHVATHITLANQSAQDAFAEYATDVIKNDTLSIILRGKAPLKQAGLFLTHVTYDKTVTMKGFNGLKGMEILNASIPTTSQPDGANLIGNVRIPNPTVQTLDLGNLTLNLMLPTNLTGTAEPVSFGYSTINNTVLYPGTGPHDNIFPMRAVTNQSMVVNAIEYHPDIGRSGGLPMIIQGKSAMYQDQEIPWLTKALSANTLDYCLLIGPALVKSGLAGYIPGLNGYPPPSTTSSSSSSASATSSSTSSSSSAAGFRLVKRVL